MKIKSLSLVTALFLSVTAIAQKDDIKAAEKALKSGNPTEAKAALDKIEYMVVNLDNPTKAQYYFVLGNVNLELAKKNIEEGKSLVAAAKAYNELKNTEASSGKSKYTGQVETSLIEVKRLLTNSAIADSNAKRFKESAQKLYEVYGLDKKDTTMLYYAAGTAINGEDYDSALSYYKMLKDLKYSGKATNYLAKNKSNGQEETFASAKDRDFSVKIGTHEAPRTENVPSKRGEIVKNIALILNQKGDLAAAKRAVEEAIQANPGDTSLYTAGMEVALKANDYATYKKFAQEALAKDPNNADLFYNLGVISGQSNDKQAKIDAEGYYLKAIQIDPRYKNAYLNLGVLKLDGEKEIVDQMNKLGTSAADMKKYEALKVKRENLYKSAIPHLEKAYELFESDKDIKNTLLNMYNALDMTDKYKALKAKN
ncbi:tetratricopeptide repeat protein [Flavobacterium oreochromis]|uniref:Uncharacterized protein n=2 Tax=Flavobacterium TaxID=237 RepID=A0A246G803_9FLAO|nr:tetratricopeptide repeat protein [Flavobacterium oreochromis]OWP74818.1 hypothetical protein BWK62_13315 [Flavobacterium oreochromis]OWP77737.1 hypothetical protein BWG23_04050 [Flavobacterium oreochromis]